MNYNNPINRRNLLTKTGAVALSVSFINANQSFADDAI